MTILIGVPCYDDTLKTGLSTALSTEGGQPGCPPYTIAYKQSSLLAFAHNALLCIALNNRPAITHLLICHADVVPSAGFLKTLYEEMLRTEAGVVSVVLPLKDAKGLTSTALLPDLDRAEITRRRDYKRRRLTMTEAERLPETFDVDDLVRVFGTAVKKPALLVNTGLMLIDVRQAFAECVHFEINDAIHLNDQGQYFADVEPEDWYFSRMLALLDVRVVATRKVKAVHVGRANFPNRGAWGEWDHDKDGGNG